MHLGLIGIIVGSVVVLAGGLFGTYCSIKNTNGPRERAFMIKANVVVWIAVLIYLGLLLILSNSNSYYVVWIFYGILMPLGIITLNRRRQKIRKTESGDDSSSG